MSVELFHGTFLRPSLTQLEAREVPAVLSLGGLRVGLLEPVTAATSAAVRVDAGATSVANISLGGSAEAATDCGCPSTPMPMTPASPPPVTCTPSTPPAAPVSPPPAASTPCTTTTTTSTGGTGQATPTPAPAVPAAPSKLYFIGSSDSQVAMAWTNPSGSTGSRVERSFDGLNWATVATVAGNVSTYTDTGLPADTAVSYRVRATNAAGVSAPVAASTATVAASNPLVSVDLNLDGLLGSSATTRDCGCGVGWPAVGNILSVPGVLGSGGTGTLLDVDLDNLGLVAGSDGNGGPLLSGVIDNLGLNAGSNDSLVSGVLGHLGLDVGSGGNGNSLLSGVVDNLGLTAGANGSTGSTGASGSGGALLGGVLGGLRF